MTKKTLQLFTAEYLQECKHLSTAQICQFLEDFRSLHRGAGEDERILISMKVPKQLLRAFRQKCELYGVKYQTHIQELMREWLRT